MIERDNLKATITARGCLIGSISSRQRLSGSISSKGSLVATITTRGQMVAHISAKGSLQATISARGQLVGSISGVKLGEEEYETYMLVYDDGTQVPAVFVENEVTFTATENDIRKGTVAATASGVTEGTKEIPAYHTSEGHKLVENGTKFVLPISDGLYEYTKLQAIFCPFSDSLANSVAAEKVAIDGHVYPVESAVSEYSITLNHDIEAVDFGFTNESGMPYLIRYFSYKEIY